MFWTKMTVLGGYWDLSFPWREDPHQVDGSGGHSLQEVHHGQRCVELRYRHVGGHFIWRATLLGDVQPGCESRAHHVSFAVTFSSIFSSILNHQTKFLHFYFPHLHWSHNLIFYPLFSPAGDQSNRRGLPSSRSNGLSCGVAPAHVGLLGEGTQRQAKVWTDCHNPGQAHQKPSQSQRAGQQLSLVSGRGL